MNYVQRHIIDSTTTFTRGYPLYDGTRFQGSRAQDQLAIQGVHEPGSNTAICWLQNKNNGPASFPRIFFNAINENTRPKLLLETGKNLPFPRTNRGVGKGGKKAQFPHIFQRTPGFF